MFRPLPLTAIHSQKHRRAAVLCPIRARIFKVAPKFLRIAPGKFRLVLADALVRAIEVGNPEGGKDSKKGRNLDGIIDVATLTGAQVVALGTRTGALMGNDEGLSAAFLQAAAESGDSFWPMPLPEELRASLDSPVADLANIGEAKGGMLVAGLFLKEFISAGLPWIHLDIAGPAYNEQAPHGYTPKGGTGMPLRSLLRFAETHLE